MVADGARVALARVPPPLRAQLGRRGARRRRCSPAAPDRGEQRAAAFARPSIGGGFQVDTTSSAASMSSTSSAAGHVGAAEAELAGRQQRVGDGLGRATREASGPPPLVAGTAVPSQKAMAKGRSGSARAISRRSGAVRANAIPRTRVTPTRRVR